jgi:hypothetical protein
MRIAVTAATLFALAACSTTQPTSPYQQPNELMGSEISQRIDQIPFQHREELIQNLLWLVQAGEQTIPSLIDGLVSDNAKVRSNCCWVLGQLRDRRTVPDLQSVLTDPEPSVRLEAARSLVLMGDVAQAPTLIEALDSDRKEVRYLCHEALKSATGHDFGYDHLGQDQQELQLAVLRWRQWWGEYSGDRLFAQSYERSHGLDSLAAPAGETQTDGERTDSSEGEGAQESHSSPEAPPETPSPAQSASDAATTSAASESASASREVGAATTATESTDPQPTKTTKPGSGASTTAETSGSSATTTPTPTKAAIEPPALTPPTVLPILRPSKPTPAKGKGATGAKGAAGATGGSGATSATAGSGSGSGN